MLSNRSVPPDSLLPHIVYADVAEAVAWLTHAFGFREHYRYYQADGHVSGAQLYLGTAFIMLTRARPGRATPGQLGGGTQSLTVFVDDVDSHYRHAQAANVKIVEPLQETVYGERQYGAEDLASHYWLFSRHARDVSPEEWGAAVAQRPDMRDADPVPGDGQ